MISSSPSKRKASEAGDIGDIEKHGVNTGHFAVNPFNGEKVPVWVANYILMDYGTGAIMSVPAHDERDYEFAKKYGIEIRQVIVPTEDGNGNASPRRGGPEARPSELPFTTLDGKLINSGEFTGLTCDEAIKKMSAYAEKHGFGKATVTYPLERLGHLAPALLGNADPNGLLREGRHRAGSRKRSAGDFARQR